MERVDYLLQSLEGIIQDDWKFLDEDYGFYHYSYRRLEGNQVELCICDEEPIDYCIRYYDNEGDCIFTSKVIEEVLSKVKE